MANETIFTRYDGNPVVKPSDVPSANSIHNSAIVRYGDGYAGVFRVDTTSFEYKLHTGRSSDGIKWQIDPEPICIESGDPEVFVTDHSYDPRLVFLEDRFYLTWCNAGAQGAKIGMAWTTDFERFVQMEDPFPPSNRNAVLFPRKLGDAYAMLHRPSDRGHTPFGDVFYSSSPDLVHWGRHRHVFGPASGWQSTKVGPGPSPLETEEGWLLIYHGVWTSCNGFLYYAGGALLDIEKPWKVIARTKKYLLGPTMPYERVGDVPNVVFPSAMVYLQEVGKVRIYYGCADTCVSMAEADLVELLAFIKDNSL